MRNVTLTGLWQDSIRSMTAWRVERVPVSCHGKKWLKVVIVARQMKVMIQGNAVADNGDEAVTIVQSKVFM